jgi:predicted nucleic acid-binding protein
LTVAFVDSSAWAALVMPEDRYHRSATAAFRQLSRGTRLITTNYVLSETYTLLRSRSGHRSAVDFHRRQQDAERVRLLDIRWVDERLHRSAWDLFERYSDQPFSFVDCTSFVLAREESVDFVFGFDRDFLTMGFDLRPAAN